MRSIYKRIISFCMMLVLVAAVTAVPTAIWAGDDNSAKEFSVLYTNDVHCETKGYAPLAAYRQQLLDDGKNVVTVDAGDAIQGEIIGSYYNGSSIIDIMNATGYDIAVPGNHEFDYTMKTFIEDTQKADFDYISANFYDLVDNKLVFKPYVIKDMGGIKVAFVGICTPETYTKSTPKYFQNDNGEYIYSFCEDDIYRRVQTAVDSARNEGAECVIAVGHTGLNDVTESWSSKTIVANTSGIDAYIDGHSHEEFIETFKNKDNKDVTVTSTGTKFDKFGYMSVTKNNDGFVVNAAMITPENVEYNTSDSVKAAFNKVNNIIAGYNSELAYIYEEIGRTDYTLTINDKDGVRRVRNGETNMADYVADAYKYASGADIAIVNGGGVRVSINAGVITRKALMDVNPFNNSMCVIEATGKQIAELLEFGAKNMPEENGGFIHGSGITYDIDMWNESPVITGSKGEYIGIDDSKPGRISNIKINNKPVDYNKSYTVAGTYYMLKLNGDGVTMFNGCKVVRDKEEFTTDADMLIAYLTDGLNGVIPEKYSDISGNGRIRVYNSAEEKAYDNKSDEKEDAITDRDTTTDQDIITDIDNTFEEADTSVATYDVYDYRMWMLIILISISLMAFADNYSNDKNNSNINNN